MAPGRRQFVHVENAGDSRIHLGSRVSIRPILLVAAFVAWAVVLVVVAARNGPGVSPDSVAYIAAARSFATDGQFTYWDGTPLSHWPPGEALILAIPLTVGVDPVLSAFVIDVLAAAAFVTLAYLLGRLLLRSSLQAVILAGLTAVALTTVHLYSMVWSEPLFVALCLTTLWLLTRMVGHGVTVAGVIAVVVCVSVACSLRYIGVSLLPVVAISLFAAEAGRGLPRAFAIGAAGAGLAALGAAAVAVRNLALVGSLTGTFSSSDASLAELVRTTVSIIGGWAMPQATVGSTRTVIAGLLILGLAALGAFRLVRSTDVRLLAVPLLAFVACYLVALIAGELRVDGFLDWRYLSPALVPVLLLDVAGVDGLWRSFGRPAVAGHPNDRRASLGALIVISVAVLATGFYVVGNANASVRYALRAGRTGVAYNSTGVRTSQLAQATAAIPGSPGLLSNDPPRVYWVTGRHPIPSGTLLGSGGDPAAAVHALIDAGRVTHFAEFTRPETTQGVSADQLRTWRVVLSDPVPYPDGTLYRVSSAAGS
jgi:hypothetical protein